MWINTSTAGRLSINVYLKLKPKNPIETLIQDFNQFLETNQVIITPYLQSHPLHLTLYLADYQQKQIPRIIKKMAEIAKKNQPLLLTTDEFIANESGYVMLSVKNERRLQQLSNMVLFSLAELRDKNAVIPAWAAQNKARQTLFKRYGSPNVLNYFKPHFSIFTAEGLSVKLQLLIAQFIKQHEKPVQASAYAIGIGVANEQGQIVRELGTISLT